MEGFSIFISILAIVWSILSIILFFKVWGMTNDVKELKQYFLKSENQKMSSSATKMEVKNEVVDSVRNIKRGDVVINLRNGKEVTVDGTTSDGKIVCYVDSVYTGIFEPNEIATKEEYSKHNK